MRTRRLQAYASLAEIISAAAIIVSLLYVGYEFRRGSTIGSREADLILFERAREGNRLLIENAGLAEIVVRAEATPDSLSRADRLRYLTYRQDFFDTWEIGWLYHADGILDADDWLEWDEWFTGEARRRPTWVWTENRRHFTGEDFLRHVDEALAGR